MLLIVIPAQAGIQDTLLKAWTPAFAGVTAIYSGLLKTKVVGKEKYNLRVYDDGTLNKYKSQCPFFTHPYQNWQTYHTRPRPDRVFDRMICAIRNINNFLQRIAKAKSDINNPLDYYSFMTEVKVAYFLLKKGKEVRFSDVNSGGPDIRIMNRDGSDIYIEVNTPLKQFAYLVRMEEELQKINSNFQWERTHFLGLNINTNWQDIYNQIETKITNIEQTQYIKKVYSKGNLRGILKDKQKINTYAGGSNAHGRPETTVSVLLNESLKAKMEINNGKATIDSKGKKYKLKNMLNNLHPNILWSEMLFLEDFQIGWNNNLTGLGLPADLDAQIVSVCGINSKYGGKNKLPPMPPGIIRITDKPFRFAIFVNEKSPHLDLIKRTIGELLPGEDIIMCSQSAEELKVFG